jgi:uncharacterized membrane protein
MIQFLINATQKFGFYLRSLFINGIITILPITITLMVIGFAARVINRFFAPVRCFIHNTPLGQIPYAEFIIIFGIILALGMVYRLFIIKSFFSAIDKLLSSVPLIRTLHTGVRQLINSLTTQDSFSFKHVVLVEFPRHGVYSLGFVMSEFPPQASPAEKKKLFSVYVPTTPNPTTGFLIICQEDQFQVVDLTRQEAMALIVSGGILQPERFTKNG